MVAYELENTVKQIVMLSNMANQPWQPDRSTEIALWSDLVAKEQERAELAQELVLAQAMIISDLRSGATAETDSVRLKLNDANEIRQALGLLGNDIDGLRQQLLTQL